jgi:ribosomal protein S18 acetylase RimI-like enzyme
MTATIRQATAADAGEIAQIQVATWRFAYAGIVPQEFLDALDPAERAGKWAGVLRGDGSHVFVAEDASAMCGFINGGALRDGVHLEQSFDSEIYTLYVVPTAQGRGAGRELMRALAVRLIEDGLKRPVVWALEKNPWCTFYERLGGKRVAQKMIEIGGVQLSDIAYGWDEIGTLLHG